MAFEKIKFAMKTWKDAVSGGTPITAAELNRIEKGISDCAKQTNDLGDSVSLITVDGWSVLSVKFQVYTSGNTNNFQAVVSSPGKEPVAVNIGSWDS